MSMSDWAAAEIAAACKRENPDWDGVSFDYGCACYQSALKAYKCLMEDGHSGTSFGFTRGILIRLLHGLPLSPIVEADFKGGTEMPSDDKTSIQCPRMSSLFQDTAATGEVTYTDVQRCYCVDIHNPSNTFTNGKARSIIDELFPITLPYYPPVGTYKVYTEEFLVDPAHGDFDTVGYLYCLTPEGERIDLNRFYTEKSGKMVSISHKEYETLKAQAVVKK